MRARDIFCVGASAGGIRVLQQMAAALPSNFPGSLFVVQHIGASSVSVLPEILARAGPLPATSAQDKEPFEPGHIYVCPPDHHLVLAERHMEVVYGPKENQCRPAIDPLFRSAAQFHGPRSVGVVASGTLADGSAGLWALDRAGGVTVVQDPADAEYPDMPRNAAEHIVSDFVGPAHQLGGILAQLALTGFTKRSYPEQIVAFENQFPKGGAASPEEMEAMGKLRPYICPECDGPLWEMKSGPLRFRCHVGHAYSVADLLSDYWRKREVALWSAARLVNEHASLMTAQAKTGHHSASSQVRLRHAIVRAQHDLAILRGLLTDTESVES